MSQACGTRHGTKFWLNYEPCGLFCGSITWVLLGFGMYGTSVGVIYPWLGFSWFGILNLILFNSVSMVSIYTHILTMITDPGSVPKSARPLPTDTEERDYEQGDSRTDSFKKFCRRCKQFKPLRAHHCSICGRCIVKMDHHCPWVNNCVGLGNHKLFLLFVFWTFLTCMYSLLLVLGRFLACARGSCGGMVDQLVMILLVVEALLFGLFTLCMLGDQMTSIFTNQSAIDRLKGTKYAQADINEVCGSSLATSWDWAWLLPRQVVFEKDMHRQVVGYVEAVEEEEEALLVAALGTPPIKRKDKKKAKDLASISSEDSISDDTITEWLGDTTSPSTSVHGVGSGGKLKADSPETVNHSPSSVSGTTTPGDANMRKRA